MKSMMAISGAALLAVGAAGRARAQQPDEGFWNGATAEVTALNFYYNRDFRSGDGQGKRAEWAQGFVVDARSGYTRGPVGAGLDLLGIGDFKLDGVRAEGGTGLLPNNDDGTAQHALVRVAPTLKLRASQTELKWGSFIPNEPLVRASITRIMPETFQGVTLESKDVPKLDLLLARFTSAWYRDGDSRVPITLTNKNRRFLGTPDSDALDLVSATYTLAPSTQLRYQGAVMEDIYRQQLYNLIQTQMFGKDRLRVDLRYFRTDDTGQSRAGPIDNRMFSSMVSWRTGGHEVGVGYQKLSGPSAMPWPGGTDGNVFNWTFINDFLERGERSWQLRYSIDGKSIGIPGLSVMARYISGDNARPATYAGEGREWARDVLTTYQFQSERFKHLSLIWFNGTFRSNYQRNVDENRLILQYRRQFDSPDR
ncbi:OprD family porin [Xanthomonas floridensis]|uniref:Porin n=1 Tax=Xanthomonas floridensis TaxID=1843580 RepID=A0A1A9M7Q2_9XANT|nr:OprD family porin [Xanthomonas floridensis]MEA5123007.1 OprD family porin [Xanthomonas floridensis]MEA5130577.1 OprD family porin [Xanthomonas floridensis]OAG66051.1 porin [Xanthomonas floridensis]